MTKCMCCEQEPAIPGSKFCQDCQGDLDIENARDMAEGHCPVGEEFASHSPAPQCGKSMCEVCGTQAAESGDFICMECISRMLLDME